MKRILMISMFLIICIILVWFGQVQHSEARVETSSRQLSDISNTQSALGFPMQFVITTDEAFSDIRKYLLSGLKLEMEQQVGARCRAVPHCPDCGGGGNVCRSVEEFYPGITMLVARRNIIAKCQRANGLDYCGGSRGCVKKPRAEQEQHRKQYGGGCYKQCERVAACVYFDNR